MNINMETKRKITLQETGNKLPFTVPENYFENLALEMDSRIAAQNTTFKKLIRPWMYMAAMFVGVFLMGNVFYTIHQQNKSRDAEMYEMYVQSQIDESIVFDYYLSETVNQEDVQ